MSGLPGMGSHEAKDGVRPLPAKPWKKKRKNTRYRNRRLTRFPWVVEMRKQLCHYCGQPGGTIDHKVPRSKGGKPTPANCVPACEPCNVFRGNRDYEWFRTVGWKMRPFAQ